jgi:NADH-quinone oxidoreductase subunit H
MKLGWKVLVPITIFWIGVEGLMYLAHIGPWKIT